MSRNLIIRTLVAAIAIPIILWISYQGGAWLFGMVMLLAVAAGIEFLLNEGYGTRSPFFWFALAMIVVCLTATLDSIPFDAETESIGFFRIPFVLLTSPLLVLFFLITSMMFSVGKQPPSELFTKHSRLMWGITYLAMLYPFVYAIGNDAELVETVTPASGGDLLLFLFGLLWVGDTAAMGFGSWLGKHKLAPGVSPRKTIEGFVGGVVGALAIALLMHFWKFPELRIGHLLVLGLGCSIFGQLGDLVESMWKRSLAIKDSSAIIPGHGGVLDRFDSLLFAAPFMYGYIYFVLA
ncbi:MAG: phosphatidate cytidylyltransferase [Candidatus Zixiibacteriota bacterium]